MPSSTGAIFFITRNVINKDIPKPDVQIHLTKVWAHVRDRKNFI